MICPRCGEAIEQETIDVGVGTVPVGPWACYNCRHIDGEIPEDRNDEPETGGEA